MKLSPARRTLFVALPLGILIGAAGAWASSPKLSEAESHVDRALSALKEAENPKEKGEFGGHRKRAIDLLDQVKREIGKAREYDDKHPPKEPPKDPKPDAGPGPKPGPGPGPAPGPGPGPGPKPGPTPDPGPKPGPGPGPGPKPGNGPKK